MKVFAIRNLRLKLRLLEKFVGKKHEANIKYFISQLRFRAYEAFYKNLLSSINFINQNRPAISK